MTKPNRYLVTYTSTEIVMVDAESEEDAIDVAQNTEASFFSTVANDWSAEED